MYSIPIPHTHAPLVRKLESIVVLSDEERQALMDLPIQVVDIPEDQDIVREGDRPSRCFAILGGFGCTYKATGDGKRQIVAISIAGDVPDVQSLHLQVLDVSVSTMTPCRIGFIGHKDLWDLCMRYPRLTAGFWRETLIESAIFREWLLNVGRRDAYARMAHVMCEMLVRLRAVGLAEDHSINLPITQAEFADVLGISTVHANRVLQELRADGLIELKGERLKVLDWEKPKQVGDFDPSYLHLVQERPAA